MSNADLLVSRSIDDFATGLEAGLHVACVSLGLELTTTATVFTAGCSSLPHCLPEHEVETVLRQVAGDAEVTKSTYDGRSMS